jgi:tRNA-binding protein
VRGAGGRYDPRALASLDEFLALDVRVGTVVAARVNQGARLPAYALTVDFGPLGRKQANARIAGLYDPEDLVGLQVVAVVNLPAERVAGLESEVQVLAVNDGRGDRVLLIPERPVPDGGRI